MMAFSKILLDSGCFEPGVLEIFWRINFRQTVGIHKNNLDCKELNYDVGTLESHLVQELEEEKITQGVW